ncbi:MAG: beta-lactamase domain protein [Subtercola sp.]|nr:beta-lactamase domain protein [Subtercola sp.]
MQLTILGTATPYPVPGNACSGYLLQGGGASIWIDAGTGTLAELQRHTPIETLDAIFISHRHADHAADLFVAYYALKFSALRPRAKIRVIGPEALADRMADFLGPDALQGLHEVFEFTEMNGWADAVVGDLTLSWGPVAHGVPAFALTVTGPASAAIGGIDGIGGIEESTTKRTSTFTYSGDTAPCISLVEMAEESTVLLCEAGYAREALGENAVHHTPEDAGRTATAAGVGTVILTHIADDLDVADAARRVGAHFAGEIVIATPGNTYPI